MWRRTSRSRSRPASQDSRSRIAISRDALHCTIASSPSNGFTRPRARADTILVARTERLLIDPSAVTPAIDALVAFAEAGADCLFAPGVRDKADIAAMVRAVAPKPLNVVVIDPAIRVAELADLGVRRISIGGSLARVAWGAMMAAAEQIKLGSFEAFATSASGKLLNETFG